MFYDDRRRKSNRLSPDSLCKNFRRDHRAHTNAIKYQFNVHVFHLKYCVPYYSNGTLTGTRGPFIFNAFESCLHDYHALFFDNFFNHAQFLSIKLNAFLNELIAKWTKMVLNAVQWILLFYHGMHRFILTYGIDEENQQTRSRCQAFFVKISIRIIHTNESNMFQWMAEQQEEEMKYTTTAIITKKETGFEMEYFFHWHSVQQQLSFDRMAYEILFRWFRFGCDPLKNSIPLVLLFGFVKRPYDVYVCLHCKTTLLLCKNMSASFYSGM